jgi:class 3 adenylate cyclase
VHTAARVQSAAQPNEVLVTRTVTELVEGTAFAFADRGEHVLKGIDGTRQLFAARASAAVTTL